ncbi:hypothetical protein DPMN_091888 [Dreissena polymorpha]|uniref:Uncharacterized protein n=1 Tax=Dreissena polymorpha TaxID=45954 RepID=A0A9D4L0B6_DREPO|nr:hypothetical protein DPMN_091888 [Dreissena polymorpha]
MSRTPERERDLTCPIPRSRTPEMERDLTRTIHKVSMRPTSTQENRQPKTQRTYAEVCRMDKERTLYRDRNVQSR